MYSLSHSERINLSPRGTKCILFLSLSNTASNGWAEKDALAPLKQIDVLFRGTYNQTRNHVLQEAGPIILASGEDLTLLYGGKKIKGSTPPLKPV